MSGGLYGFLKKRALRYPRNRVASGEMSVSVTELFRNAEVFAESLRGARGCAIDCRDGIASATALLACLFAHVAALPLSRRYGDAEADRILSKIAPDRIITDRTGTLSVFENPSANFCPIAGTALIFCTSGSSGEAKGVSLSEENLRVNASEIASYFTLTPSDTLLITRPLSHCTAVTGELFVALLRGANLRFATDAFSPRTVCDEIRRGVTALCATPTVLSILAELVSYELRDRLLQIGVSGEMLDRENGKKLRSAFRFAQIRHGYGLTECSPRVSQLPPEEFVRRPDCVGKPLPSVSVEIRDEEGKAVPRGCEGMLWVRGAGVMLGYYGDAEETARVLRDGWLQTGDVAREDADGFLYICGRRDGMIVRAGRNVFPTEIESALKRDPRVREAVAYGYGILPRKIGVRMAGNIPSEAVAIEICRSVLPDYLMPTAVEICQTLPRAESGKTVRRGMHERTDEK